MNKKVMMVDVDDTVAPSGKEWLVWYHDLTGHALTDDLRTDGRANNVLDLMHRHEDPMKFWKQPELYHGMRPRRKSVETLEALSEFFDIVFVSNSFPEHSESKKMFLKKHFPFMSAYIATDRKQYVKADVFIDDYKYYLRQVKDYQPNCECIHIKSHLTNEGEFPLMDWEDIPTHLKEKGLI